MSEYKRISNRGVLFVHKKGKHVDLMYDGSCEVDIPTCCPKCQHTFTAQGSFFLNGWRPKSEKVFCNVSFSMKGVPEGQARSTPKPAAESDRYRSQGDMNYASGHARSTPAKPHRELDDEIPF